ncbi:imidazole glycerol phosphate synthase subunit HisH [Phytohabitans houttuyneae]|uniref:Imidazole glycerol phosphate synthase subunit HisH n=1 Tax=Phytohabitans houttuyneae TaxID=1076126 RepID=A0A6V8K874_9ACTN|nr:imidazole glycerol phosphate synthase subunit HisH [Phytohabitans houttuyneae]GFJ77005.1 imidazole glycerol phosphate synthase subunit HisH [Phytohabitans houttuyneae]
MAPSVVILDYGSGNLRSAERALARAGGDVTVTPDLDAAAAADGLVVPGVGAFAACMAGVDKLGAGPVIAERVAAGRPVLGICVGAQILFEFGEEHGTLTQGLGLIPGGVTRLPAARVPHMGWNTVVPAEGSVLFAGLPEGTRFYFVHSYAALGASGERSGRSQSGGEAGKLRPEARSDVAGALRTAGASGERSERSQFGPGVTTCTHDVPFVAAVERGSLSATQFHPEKSGDAGAALLRNWVGSLV